MSGIFDDLVKSDPLKAFEGLLQSARIDPNEGGENTPITIVLLIFVGASLSFAKMFYASANFSFIQHFAATTILVAAAYVTIGMILIFFRISYNFYSRITLTLFLCVIASSIFIIVTLLFFGSISPHVTDTIAALVDLVFKNQLNSPQWILSAAPLLADVLTSLAYSFVGCAIVYAAVQAARRAAPLAAPKGSKFRQRSFASAYLVFTTIAIFFLAIDRQNFFDNAMIQFSKIDMVH